ncbi:hypothetical protein OG897_35055 [Streptomyces sp. NBC_00237]|uniref:hypothetical protein n=1 Tax=Streptomyces sp. NBC_00237 TaxID=2975687 RepID=UPI00224E794D|nr:hypothetical protein [Streptomyces sp. NBC_00237]MCX5206612.1 hypothetical protein [Streptomyces sp. NBC_00237]
MTMPSTDPMRATPTAVRSPDEDCPFCLGRMPAGTGREWWSLRSRHATSRGEVEYVRGGCGCLVVLLGGNLVRALPARA